MACKCDVGKRQVHSNATIAAGYNDLVFAGSYTPFWVCSAAQRSGWQLAQTADRLTADLKWGQTLARSYWDKAFLITAVSVTVEMSSTYGWCKWCHVGWWARVSSCVCPEHLSMQAEGVINTWRWYHSSFLFVVTSWHLRVRTSPLCPFCCTCVYAWPALWWPWAGSLSSLTLTLLTVSWVKLPRALSQR